MTLSTTISQTFTCTHAKHLASKVVSDLYQCSCYYEDPSEASILEYQEELVVMLAHGFVRAYEFGFKHNDRRVVCWQYKVSSNGDLVGGTDHCSGGIYARADVLDATYVNFMTYSPAWFELSSSEQSGMLAQHAIRRTAGDLPLDAYGYWETDRRYGSGGVLLERRTFRPL